MRPWVAIPVLPIGFALVDRQDAARVCRHRWRRVDGTPTARIDGRDVRLGRFIMHPGRTSRVRNLCGDPLDCRRENLRVCAAKGRGR